MSVRNERPAGNNTQTRHRDRTPDRSRDHDRERGGRRDHNRDARASRRNSFDKDVKQRDRSRSPRKDRSSYDVYDRVNKRDRMDIKRGDFHTYVWPVKECTFYNDVKEWANSGVDHRAVYVDTYTDSHKETFGVLEYTNPRDRQAAADELKDRPFQGRLLKFEFKDQSSRKQPEYRSFRKEIPLPGQFLPYHRHEAPPPVRQAPMPFDGRTFRPRFGEELQLLEKYAKSQSPSQEYDEERPKRTADIAPISKNMVHNTRLFAAQTPRVQEAALKEIADTEDEKHFQRHLQQLKSSAITTAAVASAAAVAPVFGATVREALTSQAHHGQRPECRLRQVVSHTPLGESENQAMVMNELALFLAAVNSSLQTGKSVMATPEGSQDTVSTTTKTSCAIEALNSRKFQEALLEAINVGAFKSPGGSICSIVDMKTAHNSFGLFAEEVAAAKQPNHVALTSEKKTMVVPKLSSIASSAAVLLCITTEDELESANRLVDRAASIAKAATSIAELTEKRPALGTVADEVAGVLNMNLRSELATLATLVKRREALSVELIASFDALSHCIRSLRKLQ